MIHRNKDRPAVVLIEDDSRFAERLREMIESDTAERFMVQGVSDNLAEGLSLIEEGVTALLLLDCMCAIAWDCKRSPRRSPPSHSSRSSS